MNKVISLLFSISVIFCYIDLYWDLVIAVTSFPVNNSHSDLITLSTYNRINGIKKYYNHDFEGAISQFNQLNSTQKDYIVYEYADSYYQLNQFDNALNILNDYYNQDPTENILYLKSKILAKLGNYALALENLELLKQNFPKSDYIRIIQFEIEKINLLVK